MSALSIEQIAARRRRAVDQLTRRDVALALLDVPAGIAVIELREVRAELSRHGVTFSDRYWQAAAELLDLVVDGAATHGDIARWLEATGTHPVRMIGLLVWEEEEEREFVAEDVHRGLVAHLEDLVADGTIDPDALLEDRPEAWQRWREAQERWLDGPYDSHRSRMEAVMDESDHEFFTAWEEADAANLEWLASALDPLGPVACPTEELARACASLRMILADDPFLRAVADLRDGVLPDDDAELWQKVAVASFIPDLDPDEDLLSEEEAAAWMSMNSGDHVAALAPVLREGPGAPVTPESLAVHACAAEEPDDLSDVFDNRDAYEFAFFHVVQIWEQLQAVEHGRLTPLGHWGLRAAVTAAFTPPG